MLNPLKTNLSVSIHLADEDPDRDLARVAALDSQRLPPGPWLVAEVDSSPIAALSLATGSFVADPFSRTVELRALLELRAQQLREPADGRRGRGRRVPRQAGRLSAALAAPSSAPPT